MTGYALVTGAAGFIGSHVCRGLLADGWRVTGVDNFDPYYDRRLKEANLVDLEAHDHFRLVEMDIRGIARAGRVLAEADVVVHLAARPGVRASFDCPTEYIAINVGGTAALLDAARRHGVRRFVFGSSSSVYGPVDPPFVESMPLDPRSPYGASKVGAESLCAAYAGSPGPGFRIAVLRFFTVYGPRLRPDLAVHRFTRAILAGEPVPQYGDGLSERDYTAVGDVVRGVVAAAEWTDGPPACETFNLGRGHAVPLRRLIELVGAAAGRSAEIDVHPDVAGEVPRTEADIGKARAILGYTPTVSIEDGIPAFVEWYQTTYGCTT